VPLAVKTFSVVTSLNVVNYFNAGTGAAAGSWKDVPHSVGFAAGVVRESPGCSSAGRSCLSLLSSHVEGVKNLAAGT